MHLASPGCKCQGQNFKKLGSSPLIFSHRRCTGNQRRARQLPSCLQCHLLFPCSTDQKRLPSFPKRTHSHTVQERQLCKSAKFFANRRQSQKRQEHAWWIRQNEA